MSNRSQYKAMMEDVHAPAELLVRVKGIPMEKKQVVRNVALKYATATCAALLGIFAVTNGVCYAATGDTWVEKAIIYVNGQAEEVDVKMTQSGDHTIAEVEYEVSDDEGSSAAFVMTAEGEDLTSGDYTFEVNDYKNGTYTVGDGEAEGTMVLEKGGAVYLSDEGVEPIDITDQLKEAGAATGTYEKDGKTYVYVVTGESGNYSVSVELQ